MPTLKCTILRVERLYKVTRAPNSDQTKDFTIFSTSAKTSSGDLKQTHNCFKLKVVELTHLVASSW